MASIEHRKGKGITKAWRVKYRDPSGKQRSVAFRTEGEATRYRAQVEVEVNGGQWVDPDGARVTLTEWFAYCEAQVFKVAPSTATRSREVFDYQVAPAFGHVPIGAITRDDIRAWIADLEGGDYAAATVVKAHQTLSKTLEAAVPERLRFNPARHVKVAKPPRHQARFLEPHEVRTLAEAIDPDYRLAVYLGAVCGLRASELFGVRWCDIDARTRTKRLRSGAEVTTHGHVDVLTAVKESGGATHEGAPKYDSVRRVGLPLAVADEVRAHRVRMGAAGRDTEGTARVFTTPTGGTLRGSNFRTRVWAPATTKAGLGKLVLHELRHSACAGWIAAGASGKEVARLAGHRSVVTVLDRYGHLYESSEAEVMAALDVAYAPPSADVVNLEAHRSPN